MSLVVELSTEEIPELYKKFASMIGDSYWERRVLNIKDRIRGNAFLTAHLQEENVLAFALDRCRELTHDHGQIPIERVNDPELYPALSFVAQTLSIIDNSPKTQAAQFTRRIQGAFKNPPDLHALQLELHAATHFIHAGHEVIWPEMTDNSIGTFDIFLPTFGKNGTEAECKSFSSDKGRKIHQQDALTFFDQATKLEVASVKGGVTIITVTAPDRFPSHLSDISELAKSVCSLAPNPGNTVLPNNFEINIKNTDTKALHSIIMEERRVDKHSIIKRLTGILSPHAIIRYNKYMTDVLILIIQSAKNESVLSSVFDTFSSAAKRQLSGTRPAILFGGFSGINAQEIVSLAAQDNDPNQPATALRVATSRFLSEPRRSHIISTIFLCKQELSTSQNGIVNSSSPAYAFDNNRSPFWEDVFDTIMQRGNEPLA